MRDPTLRDESAEIEPLTDLQLRTLQSIYEAPNEGLRLWQVQKKVSATKVDVQEALSELLARGYIGILSMGGGPKYHKVASKTHIVAALQAHDTTEQQL
ncbi:MAG: hypothetical protein ACXVIG_07045 [Halobacteriota archaeon]